MRVVATSRALKGGRRNSASLTTRVSLQLIPLGGEPLFRAADVCPHLGLADVRQALERVADDEKVKKIHRVVSGQSDLLHPPPVIEWYVTEPGLYQLILTSTKADAQRFQRWVTHEVLPSIRRGRRLQLGHALGDQMIT